MSNVKIRKLSLQNFRGAKELLELDLGGECRSCAIFGNNASGKSTLTQAIEWFYRGKVAHLSGEGISEDDFINLASTSDDDTFVSIEFSEANLNASKIFDKKTKRHKYSVSSPIFRNYIDVEAAYDRLYLDQQTILWFLSRTKGEKRVEIAKIVGYEDIVKVKSLFSSVLHDLVRDPRLEDAKRRLAFNQGLLTKEIYGESVGNIPDLIKKSQPFLEVFGIKSQTSSLEELNKLFDEAFRLLPSQERAKERVELEKMRADLSELNDKLSFVETLRTWISGFNELTEDQNNLASLNYYEFLRQAERILSIAPDTKSCPLCEQEIESNEALLADVVERYRRLDQIRKKLEDKKRESSPIKVTLRDISDRCSRLSKDLDRNNISCDLESIRRYSSLLDETIVAIETQLGIISPIDIDVDKLNIANSGLNEGLAVINTDLRKKIAGLTFTREEEERQSIYQRMVRGRDLVLSNIDYEKRVAAYNLLIKNMQKIEEQMLELQNNTMRQVLELLSGDINTYFCKLNKKEKVKNVKLETKGEEGIEFTLEFYDREASPPRKYLSESQLNSLGIAFFLAAVKKFNRANKFFVLDDVLVSFDRNYRLRLLELLEEEFADYQVILMTHEEYWYQMIRKKFPTWVLDEVCWEFSTGSRFKGLERDQLESIKAKHSKGEKIGNELRIFVESLLKDICGALEVKLAYRPGIDNERRMIGEMLPGLTNALKSHKSDIHNSDIYKGLEVSSFIMSCASHDNPDLDSLGDMEETIEKIQKFRELFLCPKGRMITRKNAIPGQDMISCKCGCIKIAWKD